MFNFLVGSVLQNGSLRAGLGAVRELLLCPPTRKGW